jgi:hypothetical protein
VERPSAFLGQRGARPARSSIGGVEGNARLTGTIAAVLLVLLAAEGITVLRVGALLRYHVFIGMLLVPPIVLKIESTGYRFVRYYAGSPAYRRKGPPPALLRVLGPLVVVLTIVLFASGIGVLFSSAGLRRELLFVHRISFFLWFAAMTVHVLGHIRDTSRLAPGDFYWRTRKQVAGAGLRQWAIAASLVVGALLGAVCLGQVGHFLAGRDRGAAGTSRIAPQTVPR